MSYKSKRKNTRKKQNKKRSKTSKRNNLKVKGKNNKRLNELADTLNSMTEEGFQSLLMYFMTKDTFSLPDNKSSPTYSSDIEEEYKNLFNE